MRATCFAQNKWDGEHTMGKISMRLFRKGADKDGVVCGVSAEDGEDSPMLPHPAKLCAGQVVAEVGEGFA